MWESSQSPPGNQAKNVSRMNPCQPRVCWAWPLTSLCRKEWDDKVPKLTFKDICETAVNHRNNISSRAVIHFQRRSTLFLNLAIKSSLARDILWTLNTVCLLQVFGVLCLLLYAPGRAQALHAQRSFTGCPGPPFRAFPGKIQPPHDVVRCGNIRVYVI